MAKFIDRLLKDAYFDNQNCIGSQLEQSSWLNYSSAFLSVMNIVMRSQLWWMHTLVLKLWKHAIYSFLSHDLSCAWRRKCYLLERISLYCLKWVILIGHIFSAIDWKNRMLPHGHLIWPLVHLVWHSAILDWPSKFKDQNVSRRTTNFQNLTSSPWLRNELVEWPPYFKHRAHKATLHDKFLVAPSLRAERLIWSLWRVSVCTFVSHRGTPPLPVEIIGSQKFQNQNVFQLILSNFSGGGGTLPPSKGKIFWHQIWLDTCSDWQKKFFQKNFFYAHFIEFAEQSVSQFSS